MRIVMNIKEIRKNKGLSLSLLARRSGVSKSHISAIENGDRMPSLLVAIEIATALDVKLFDLYKIDT